MRVNLISNLGNGAGLERDTKLIRGFFEEKGWQIVEHQFNSPFMPPVSDWNVFIETFVSQWCCRAKYNVLAPNPEWFHESLIGPLCRYINSVWCKTQDGFRIFSGLVGAEKCVYIGFEANDLYLPSIVKQRKFLHAPGKSVAKNTEALVQAWCMGIKFPLTVITYHPFLQSLCTNCSNITIMDRLSDDMFQLQMNTHRFFILPSQAEGFGHVLHEALGCKAVVFSTNASPMNEFGGIDKRLLLSVREKVPRFVTWFHNIEPRTVKGIVDFAFHLSDIELDIIGENARYNFIEDKEKFRKKIRELIPDAK